MNITESTNVHVLLSWLLDPHSPDHAEPAAREAAAYLADRARSTLGAGLAGAAVEAGWRSMLTSCAGCTSCAGTDHRTDPAPLFGTVQVHTDAWGVHTDADGRGYVLVDVDGGARFVPRSDPHGHEAGPDSAITVFRSPECGSGQHNTCTGRARWRVEDRFVDCECTCHEKPAGDALDGARSDVVSHSAPGDDSGADGAVVLAWRRVPLAQLRARLAGTPGRAQVRALAGAA
jgi:hypothetical protein